MPLTQSYCRVPGGFDYTAPGQGAVHVGSSAAAVLMPVPAPVAIPVVNGVPAVGQVIQVTCPEGAWWVWADGNMVYWSAAATPGVRLSVPGTAGDRCINLWLDNGTSHFSIT